MKVNIVIPNYEGGSKLDRCIASIQANDYENWNVTIVDNASLLWAVRDDYGERVDVIRNARNMGFAHACNRGVKYEYPYTFFLNNDCVIEHDTIGKLVSVLAIHPHVAAACPIMRTSNSNLYYCGGEVRWIGTVYHNKSVLSDVPYYTTYLNGAGIMVKTALWSQYQFSQEYFMYYEDIELSVRLRRAGWTLLVVPDAHIVHDVGGSSSGKERYWMIWKSGITFIRRNRHALLQPLAFLCHTVVILSRFVYRRIRKW